MGSVFTGQPWSANDNRTRLQKFENEIETSNRWTDVEKTDIDKAISLLEEYGNTGRVSGKQYRELIYLDNLLPFEKSLKDVQYEERNELTKHDRLSSKLNLSTRIFC